MAGEDAEKAGAPAPDGTTETNAHLPTDPVTGRTRIVRRVKGRTGVSVEDSGLLQVALAVAAAGFVMITSAITEYKAAELQESHQDSAAIASAIPTYVVGASTTASASATISATTTSVATPSWVMTYSWFWAVIIFFAIIAFGFGVVAALYLYGPYKEHDQWLGEPVRHRKWARMISLDGLWLLHVALGSIAIAAVLWVVTIAVVQLPNLAIRLVVVILLLLTVGRGLNTGVRGFVGLRRAIRENEKMRKKRG